MSIQHYMGWIAFGFAVIFLALLLRERRRSSVLADTTFRSLADGSPSGIVVFDATHILYANQLVIELAGSGKERSVVGRRLDQILAPATAQTALDGYQQIMSSDEGIELTDYSVTGRNGMILRCDLKIIPVIFNGRKAAQAAFLPVEGRQRAVDALRRTEERFHRFFDDMPVPMYRTRLDGTIVHANTALATLLGVADAADMVGVDAATFYAQDGERNRLAGIQRTQGLLEDQISMLVGADERQIWVRDSSHTVEEGGEQIFEGALVDVTQGEMAIRELQLRVRQQQALAHIGQVALRSFDVGEVLKEAAEQICDVLRVECTVIAQEQEGHGVLATSVAYRTDSANRRDQVLGYLQRHVAAANGTDDPIPLPPTPGGEGVSPIGGLMVGLSGSRESYGVIGVGGTPMTLSDGDISFLGATAATLGSAIERARARAHLERLMRSKDEFVASVSHELRTPLTVVAGLALELESHWRRFTAAETAEFISLIADQSRDMSDLIEDLLVVAQADIGKVSIHLADTNLRSCVDQVVAACSLADRARMSVAGTDVYGDIDPVRFRQVVRNLVTNAIRYGGPNIHIRLENGEGHARVTVFDDGAGIPEEYRDRIFDPYERAHSTSGVPGSVGLGLTVSQKLAELMGGSISYRYDGGSLFELEVGVPTDLPRST